MVFQWTGETIKEAMMSAVDTILLVGGLLVALVAFSVVITTLCTIQERWLKRRQRKGRPCCESCIYWERLEMECGRCLRHGWNHGITRWAWDRACRGKREWD